MKTSIRRAALVFAAVAALGIASVAAAYVVPVRTGTPLNAHLTDTLSSSAASAGQTFQIIAADPLVMQGWIVVVKGALGQGHVVSVTAPKGKKGASITVQFDWITAVDGTHLPLTASNGKSSALVFGAGGPFASNFPKGKEISVGPDLVFPAYASTDRVVTINSGG